MRRTRTAAKVLAAAVALMAAGHSAAQAQTWWDPTFMATGTSVTVRYLGGDAAFFDTMQWFQIPFSGVSFHSVPGPDVVNYEALGGVTGGAYTNLFTNKTRTLATKSLNNLTTIVNAGVKNNVNDAAYLTTTPGSEVLLALFVNNEQGPASAWAKQDGTDYTYFTGPGRNVDGTFHLMVEQTGFNTFAVYSGGWEDRRYGGDLDYNDFLFSIEGVSVTPEPVSMMLIGTGLAGVAAAAKRRRRRESTTA